MCCRFSFLDFVNEEGGGGSNHSEGDAASSSDSSASPSKGSSRPTSHSPVIIRSSPNHKDLRRRPDSSPLIFSHRSSTDPSPSHSPSIPVTTNLRKSSRQSEDGIEEMSPRKMLHNGIMDTYFPGHSRNSSGESSSSKDSGVMGADSGGEEEGERQVPSGELSQLTVR